MKVKITKSIDIADKAPYLPQAHVTKGQTRDDLSDHIANRLIELDCAVEIVDDEVTDSDTSDDNESEVVETVDDTSDTDSDTDSDTSPSVAEQLADIVIKNPKEKKCKNALEKWGKDNLGVDIDRRMNVDNIVEVLTAEAVRQASE